MGEKTFKYRFKKLMKKWAETVADQKAFSYQEYL
jgi:hypothetical protein